MRFFENPQAALAFVMPELLATMRKAWVRMEGDEHCEDPDREDMYNKILDLEGIEGDVCLRSQITVGEAWQRCKAEPGAFGNLYDPQEILTIMDGWEDDFEFDPENAEDVAAITAWCEAEGSDFEDQISNLVCENLPKRKDAYAALANKRGEEVKKPRSAWAETPEHPVSDWRLEVANDETRLGYLAWVDARIENENLGESDVPA